MSDVQRPSKPTRHAADWKNIKDGGICPICFNGLLRPHSAHIRPKRIGWFRADTKEVMVFVYECNICKCRFSRDEE